MVRDIERRDFLKGVSVAGIAGLAGCTGDGGDGTETGTDSGGDMTETDSGGGGGSMSRDSPVRVGVLMPETGDLSSVGVPIRDGALLPAVQLEGETDFTIETQVADTQTDPQAGISAAENLVNSGYPAITGPASSGVNLQVTRQVLIPSGVVGCSPSSTSPNVTTLEDNDLIFRTPPSDALQGQVIAQVGTDELEASTAATMYVNNDYGQALSESFESAFSGEVANAISFEKEQPSYTSRLETALQNDPDMLVVIGYPASGIQLFRDYYNDFDTGVDIVVTDGLKDPELPGEVGSDMSNVIGTAPTAAGPGREFFSDLYQEEYGSEPGVFTSQAYDATAVLILANVAAGENTGTAIRDNLRAVANPEGDEYGPSELADAVAAVAAGDDINYVGASSPVDFDENGDMRTVTYEIFGFTSDGVETQQTIEFGG
jgi:ABC-type branched-subunit amino acid transport system substrate-binding protein